MSLSPEDKKKIGGSDVAAIVGVSPYGGPLSVWMRVVHGDEREDTPHLSRGRRLEPVVLDWYAETTGRQLMRNPNLALDRRPGRRATLDGVSRVPDGDVWRVVEAKTANAQQAAEWGEEGTDHIPMSYIPQVQWYMGAGMESGLVTDTVCDVPALVAGDFRLYSVAYDAELYAELSERVDRFWVDHVLTGKPPKPTTRPNDFEAVARRFRRHDGEHLDFSALHPEAQATLEEYLRAYAEESAAAGRLALWETRAKLVLGSAPGVKGLPESSGFKRLDWKAQPGKAKWKEICAALVKQYGVNHTQLSALVAENTGEGSRPFTPRPLREKTI